MLKLVEYFWTFQGEGANWGRRALFVRLPFCNLHCSWCDTEFNKFENVSLGDFVEFATKEKCRFAVITGGEPTMNKQLPSLILILKDLGFELAIESNGTFPIPEGIDFVTVSPKSDADFEVHPLTIDKVNEFKFVVDDDFDFKVLDSVVGRGAPGVRYSLSPEFNNFNKNVATIETYIKEHPKWRLSLQTHKWIGAR